MRGASAEETVVSVLPIKDGFCVRTEDIVRRNR